LLDTMVLCEAISSLGTNSSRADLSRALRRYEKTRRRQVSAVSRVASLQVAHGESVLRPAALMSDRLHTWALTKLVRLTSHPRIAAQIDHDLAAGTPIASHPR
jgi:FAD-dependent urate hydroxylase